MITLGLVANVDTDGVYVTMPGSRGLLRGPYRTINDVAVGASALVISTDDGEQIVVGVTSAPPRTGVFNVREYGAAGDGTHDDSPHIQTAITACLAAGGGVVYLPPGDYKIDTTLDLTNIHTAFDLNQGASVTLQGAGRHATYLTGGEPGCGFIELVGSQRVTVSDMSLVATGWYCQYGILAGRPAGDHSSGEMMYRNLHVYGPYSLAAIFTMSSEAATFDHVGAYNTQGGHGIVLASDLDGWSAYTGSKYEPLSTTVPILGGNGVINMHQSGAITATTTKSPLWIEYCQSFTAVGCSFLSYGGPVVTMAKGAHEATFIGMHQEYDQEEDEPFGFYLAASANTYRLSVTGSSVYPMYGESTSTLADFSFRSSRWRGAREWQMDMSALKNADIHYDPSAATEVTAPKYRARTSGVSNQVSPAQFTTTERNAFTTDLGAGRYVFDTTLGIPIWSTASDWVDATGTVV